MADQDRRPYVRYRITGDIHDKGIAFSADRAIKTFLARNGFDGRPRFVEKSSSRFEIILELFDNGKYDFNAQALREDIAGSKQMPSRTDIIPDVTITPIPVDYGMQKTPGSDEARDEKDVAWQKTVEALNGRITDYEERIQDLQRSQTKEVGALTDLLQARQRSLEESGKKIIGLEARLKSTEPTIYPDAVSAVIRGYIPSCFEELFEAIHNWTSLPTNRDREVIAGFNGDMNFIGYVKAYTGLGLKDEAELEEMKRKMAAQITWDDSEEGKRLAEERVKLTKDRGVLESVQNAGVSTSMLEAIKSSIQTSEARFNAMQSSAEPSKARFREMKRVYGLLPQLTEGYSAVSGVYKAIRERAERGAEIPMIVHYQKNANEAAVYLPSLRFNSTPNSAENEIIREVLKLPGKLFGTSYQFEILADVDGCNVVKVKYGNQDSAREAIERASNHQTLESPVLKALGFRPKAVVILE